VEEEKDRRHMAKDTPPTTTPEEFRRLNRDLMHKILDRAVIDPAWKQRLLDDPEAAMMEAGFAEIERLRETQARTQPTSEEAGVLGQQWWGRYYETLHCLPLK
jgi:hypothetical protein